MAYKIVSIQDTKLAVENSNVVVHVRCSKTGQSGKGGVFNCTEQITQHCPVLALDKYLEFRPAIAGPLFCHTNGSHRTRYQFSALPKRALE
jgi:hypothetical protein